MKLVSPEPARTRSGPISMRVSDWVRSAIRIPVRGKVLPFSFHQREYLIQILDGRHRRVLLMIGRQSEKTAWKGSMVLMADGSSKPIESVHVGDRVVSLAPDGASLTVSTVTWKSECYTKSCRRVETRQGHVSLLGVTHPVRQWRRWTETSDLKVGDRVAVVRRAGEFTGAHQIDDKIVEYIGFMIGDGSTINHPEFTQMRDTLVHARFLEVVGQLGWTTRVSPKKGSNSDAIHLLGDQPKAVLREAGLLGHRSATKRVPPWVWQLDRRQTALFLNRLWSTDGSVKPQVAGRTVYNVVYGTISMGLALDVQRLLWKFGIPTRIRVQTPKAYEGTDKRLYLVRVETQPGVRRFLQEIGALGKTEQVPIPDQQENNNRDTYPKELNEDIHRLMGYLGHSRAGYYEKSLHTAGLRRTPKYPLTPRKLAEYVSFFRSRPEVPESEAAELEAHLDSDLFWDEVASISDIGVQECYDICVEPNNTFIADGIVTHNSTTQGNRMLALACMIPHYKCLYVSPSQQQTRKFSQDRIAQPLIYSTRLQSMMKPINPDNVHQKVLRNQASIELRYANRSADRARGIPADYLAVDELQDVFIENIPVLEETLSHSDHPTHSGWRCYSFTPKSLDNTGSYYWGLSTQTELMLPCRRHGEYNKPGTWYWFTVEEKHLGKKGVICDRCGNIVDRFDPMRGWVDGVPDALFKGYRIPQMLTPSVADDQWEDKVLTKYKHYPRPQFFNEVMAIPWESGIRPLSEAELVRCCDPSWTMSMEQLKEAMSWSSQREIFMGTDWGTAEKSWSVVALGTYMRHDVFKIFYLHRFTGLESSPEAQGRLLVEIFNMFKVRISFGDYGIGFHQNHVLQEAVGIKRHHKIRYVAEAKKKIYWNPQKLSWIGVRDDLMAAFANAVKQGRIEFPAWPAFRPFAQDFLNVTTEFNEARQKTVFGHHPEKPDDSFHACLYCLLAASLVNPRPDIFKSVPKAPRSY